MIATIYKIKSLLTSNNRDQSIDKRCDHLIRHFKLNRIEMERLEDEVDNFDDKYTVFIGLADNHAEAVKKLEQIDRSSLSIDDDLILDEVIYLLTSLLSGEKDTILRLRSNMVKKLTSQIKLL